MSRFFFFNDTATTEIYTLSLHDALPIWRDSCLDELLVQVQRVLADVHEDRDGPPERERVRRRDERERRSEEHTSELQSRQYLVCRLLLEKKKNIQNTNEYSNDTRYLV